MLARPLVRWSLALLLVQGAAVGSPQSLAPASLLVFPEFVHSGSDVTILTVTNTHPSASVRIRWTYVEGASCLVFNRDEDLTAFDTRSVLTAVHNPNPGPGYAHVHAVDAGGQAIAFDRLVGSCRRLNATAGFEYEIPPFAFRAVAPEGSSTDVDGDSRQDFDNVEYEAAPDRILLPRFLAPNSPGALETELILITLNGGTGTTTTVDLLAYNDNSVPFSAQYAFQCSTKARLVDISGVFSAAFLAVTAQSPAEPHGTSTFETGWLRIAGSSWGSGATVLPDPAILACAIENIAGRRSAELPFIAGQRLGGSLRPTPLPPPSALPPPGDSPPARDDSENDAKGGPQ